MVNNNVNVFGEDWFVQTNEEVTFNVSECSECHSCWFPTRDICPNCLSEQLLEKQLSSIGEVYSLSTLQVTSKQFDRPLTIGYIDYPENVRVFGQIVGDAKIGSKVKAIYGKIRTDEDEVPIYSYKFKSIDEGV